MTTQPKIAVYAICLNEVNNISGFVESMSGADYVLICDTGSTDGTLEKLKEYPDIIVKNLSIKPWRFDDARNAALALLPDDIDFCFSLDIDERFIGDWNKLREVVGSAAAAVSIFEYYYIWDWNHATDPAQPTLAFYAEKFHQRHGYRWLYPCHETLLRYDGEAEQRQRLPLEFQIHHFPGIKSRQQYLPLLRQATIEYPNHPRPAFYYGRELFFHGLWQDAINQLNIYVNLPNAIWAEERAQAHILIGRCEQRLGNNPLPSYFAAQSTCPDKREIYWYICSEYYQQQHWPFLLTYAELGLAIKVKPVLYLDEPQAWGSDLFDYAAIAAFKLDKFTKAVKYGEAAVRANPGDQRLHDNLIYYRRGKDEQHARRSGLRQSWTINSVGDPSHRLA